jgi:hypothetical protein
MASGESEDIIALELAVHRALRGTPAHFKGEWYNLSVEEAIRVVMRTAREIGVAVDAPPRARLAEAVGHYATARKVAPVDDVTECLLYQGIR